MIVRTGDTVAGTKVITGLKKTIDLAPKMFVYACGGIAIDTLINTVDSSSQITVSRNAIITGSQVLKFTNANVGVYQEMNDALYDAKSIIDERGTVIQFIYRHEQNVERDDYNSIKKKSNIDTKYFFRAYPVEFRPNEKRLEKAGLREECDVLVWTAMKDWMDIGLNFSDIILNLNHSIILEGETYEIRDKALVSQFADTFLYITLGAFKR